MKKAMDVQIQKNINRGAGFFYGITSVKIGNKQTVSDAPIQFIAVAYGTTFG